ncbi:MAG: DnaJ C-terminal domain-containing protein [Phycisphaerales bacterium]|jgi:DnaJ-class molecular chaperone|nr:DnaJ C-terminal domain-containing protein [Phycisphaerales bacterium]
MTATNDYYKVLGVERKATADEIRKAYRKLARKYHPDVNKEDDAATRFAEVQEAYDTLSDADKRKMYDQFGSSGPRSGGYRSDPRWQQSGGHGQTVDFSDIFGSVFGGGAGGSPFNDGANQQVKGQNIETQITVTFMTALRGGTEEINTGDSTSKVKIPAGIESGKKLRLKGKGHPGTMGGQPGDMIVTVSVGGHPLYQRRGLDVEIDVDINIAEAALGTKVTLPLPLGGSVDMTIPPGVSSSSRLRVKGKGCESAEGKFGDFYAVIHIVAPTDLDDKTRGLLEEIKIHLPNPREGDLPSG